MNIQSKCWQNAREIVLVAAACWFCAQAEAQLPPVTSTADMGPGTLRAAIAANEAGPGGGTVTFTLPTFPSTISLTSGELGITKNVTITGPGATNLSVINTAGRVFHLTGGIVTISGLRISGVVVGADGTPGNANSPSGSDAPCVDGGGILDEGNTFLLVLQNCIMDHCLVQGGNGGDAYNSTNNYPPLGNGGAGGCASGGALAQNAGDLLLSGCTFFSNSTVGGNGGHGRYGGVGGRGGDADGGAVQCEYSANNFALINSTFNINEASAGTGGHGGGAWGGDGALNGGAGGNGGDAYGGAIYVNSGCKNCLNPNCRGLDACTVYSNACSVGPFGQGGGGAHGGADGAAGAQGNAYGCGVYFLDHTGVDCLKFHSTIVAGDYALPTGVIPQGWDVGVPAGHSITDQGWNLIGIMDANSGLGWGVEPDLLGTTAAPWNPRLGPLQYNDGGPTPTMAPLPCSPVIDAGSDVLYGNGTDQVGQPLRRPKALLAGAPALPGDGSDIGAFELQSYPPGGAVALNIALAPSGSVIISWPASSCFILQQTPTLNPCNWVNTPNAPAVVGAFWQVTIAPAVGQMFYRVHP